MRPSIRISMGADRNVVSVTDKGETTTFDRSAMDRPERNRLRRMIVDATVKTGIAKRKRNNNRSKRTAA